MLKYTRTNASKRTRREEVSSGEEEEYRMCLLDVHRQVAYVLEIVDCASAITAIVQVAEAM